MNEKAITAYAQRILKAGDSYAILRRGLKTIFMDGPIILDISDSYGLHLAPYVLNDAHTGTPEYALVFGHNWFFPGPSAIWKQIDAWIAAEPVGVLTPTGGGIDCSPLHETWPFRDKPDHAATFTCDGTEIHINERLLNLVSKWPYAPGDLILERLASGVVRIRYDLPGGNVVAFVNPLTWLGGQRDGEPEKAEALR